jgi:hypothetical protein
MFIEEEEVIFRAELLDQREKVEKECVILQALIDSEIPDISFMWHVDSNCVNIIDDIFRNVVDKNCINIRFQVDESDNSTPDNSVVPHNSHVPNQIYLHKIGNKGDITPNLPSIFCSI